MLRLTCCFLVIRNDRCMLTIISSMMITVMMLLMMMMVVVVCLLQLRHVRQWCYQNTRTSCKASVAMRSTLRVVFAVRLDINCTAPVCDSALRTASGLALTSRATVSSSFSYRYRSEQPLPYNSGTCMCESVRLSTNIMTMKVMKYLHATLPSCLWNQLPMELRLLADHEDLALSSDLTHVSSSFVLSPLSPSITPSLFHSRLKTHLFTNPLLHSSSTFSPTGLIPRTPAVFRFSRVCRFLTLVC